MVTGDFLRAAVEGCRRCPLSLRVSPVAPHIIDSRSRIGNDPGAPHNPAASHVPTQAPVAFLAADPGQWRQGRYARSLADVYEAMTDSWEAEKGVGSVSEAGIEVARLTVRCCPDPDDTPTRTNVSTPPPEVRNPTHDIDPTKACRVHLRSQLLHTAPRIVVAVGPEAQQALVPRARHGRRWRFPMPFHDGGQMTAVCVPEPRYLTIRVLKGIAATVEKEWTTSCIYCPRAAISPPTPTCERASCRDNWRLDTSQLWAIPKIHTYQEKLPL